MKVAQKIVFKQIVFLCTLAHTLPVLAVRPIWAKAGVSAVAVLAAANVGRSYREQYYSDSVWRKSDSQKRLSVGSSAAVGLGATGAAAFFLHKRLPIQRLKQAADLRISVRDWHMMNPSRSFNPNAHTIPLASEEGKAIFYQQLERHYRNYRFSYDEAFGDLIEKNNDLRKAEKLTSQAQADFKADDNQGGVQACQLELNEQNNLIGSVGERILLIKAHPQFASQARDAQVVVAAKKQASAAQEAATNTSVIAAASVVSAVNSFRKK